MAVQLKIIFLGFYLTAYLTNLMHGQAIQNASQPLRVGVVGLTHSHVHWILGSPDRGDIEIVGIVEPNQDLAKRYTQQHGLSMDLVYTSMEEMLDQTLPEAVTAFGTIFEHLEVVKVCAPRGIHVMVEKPLAVNLEHALEMELLARKYNIQLLTNYETTWYATNHRIYQMVFGDQAIGDIRKIVVHDGHEGPKKIGVNNEFLEWLTDPVQNGGGAIIDFGCYGANLITWLKKGEKPESVSAITQQFQPEDYPRVDDEATILLTYPGTQGVIQASWNWPIARKDMEVYGVTGQIFADNRSQLRFQLDAKSKEKTLTLEERPHPLDDPFAYFKAVLEGEIKPEPFDLSSLENNMLVMEILDAAIRSAKSGRTVYLK